MGTRGLYCVVQDGELKVAQYGQWDAYPSGQGAVVLNFLRTKVDEGNLDDFRKRVSELGQLAEDEVVVVEFILVGIAGRSVWFAIAGLVRPAGLGIGSALATGQRTDRHLRTAVWAVEKLARA